MSQNNAVTGDSISSIPKREFEQSAESSSRQRSTSGYLRPHLSPYNETDLGTFSTVRDDGVEVFHTEKRRDMSNRVVTTTKVVDPEERVVETVVKIPHKIYRTNITERHSGKIVEELIEVPKIIKREKFVEGPPEVVHVDVPRYETREINHIHEQVIYKEVEVVQHVEVPTHQVEYKAVQVPIPHHIPELYESVAQYQVVVPRIVPVYRDIVVPIYLPRFVESFGGVDAEEDAAQTLNALGISAEDLQKPTWIQTLQSSMTSVDFKSLSQNQQHDPSQARPEFIVTATPTNAVTPVASNAPPRVRSPAPPSNLNRKSNGSSKSATAEIEKEVWQQGARNPHDAAFDTVDEERTVELADDEAGDESDYDDDSKEGTRASGTNQSGRRTRKDFF